DRFARLVRLDHVGQFFGAVDRLAVNRHDDVAADRDLAVFGVGAHRAAVDAGLFGAGALLHALHEGSALDRQVERGQRAVNAHRGQSQVGAADGAALLERRELGFGLFDRNGEADADAAVATAAGL